MNLPSFLQTEPDTDFIRLTGHRVGLAETVRLCERGCSAEIIAASFPTVSLSLIYSVLAYYLDNKTEVDDYVAADDATLHAQEMEFKKSKPNPTSEELQGRFAKLRPSGS